MRLRILAIALLAAALPACGGGGGTSPSPSSPTTALPPLAVATTPGVAAPSSSGSYVNGVWVTSTAATAPTATPAPSPSPTATPAPSPSPTATPAPSPSPTVLITIIVPICAPGKLLPIADHPAFVGILLDPSCNLGEADVVQATSDNAAVSVAWTPQAFNRYAFTVTGHGANITLTDVNNGATVTVTWP